MDPNKTIVARSVTNLMLVGVLLSLIGALVLLARLLTATPVSIDVFNAWGGVPFLAGAVILCFRYGVLLDRQQRTSTKWWGLLVPFHTSMARPLSKNCYVSISKRRDVDPSKASPLDNAVSTLLPVHDGFSVRLEEQGGDAIALKDVQDHDEARRLAEEVAKFLDVALRDRSSNEEVIREAGKLDEPLREQLRRTGQSVPLPAQIEGASANFSYGGIGAPTSIEMPPAGINARSASKAAFSACSVPLVFLIGFGKVARNMEFGSLLVLLVAMFLLGLVLVLPLLIRAITYREQLVVSRDDIVITQHGVSGTKTTRLTIAEVEEVALMALSYPRSFHDSMCRVVIRGDRASVKLGATLLKAEEVQWLREALIHVLTPTSNETEAGGHA